MTKEVIGGVLLVGPLKYYQTVVEDGLDLSADEVDNHAIIKAGIEWSCVPHLYCFGAYVV